ncbi:MAG: magnesium/cobalt transporter CorA [Armatimonadetes bacterium]|nr:magnesium/cobalt transporter CorA [Armatimonadota bacterium]
MYLATTYQGKSRIEPKANLRIARAWCEQPADHLWIDVEAPTAEELAFLQSQFQLHPLAVEECDHTGVRPKIEEFPGHLYMVIHGMNHNPGANRLDTVEFKFFLTRGRLITIHNAPSSSICVTQERLAKDPQFMARGVDNVLHQIIDVVIDHYFPVLEAMEDRVEQLEVTVFKNPGQEVLEAILDLRRESLKLQRLIQPQLDLLGALASGRFSEVDPPEVAYFRDVYDHVLRINDRLHAIRDSLGGTMDCYLSTTSNRMNEIMKTLTVVATVVLPVTFLTSLLGMNYEHLPGKEDPVAFWWVAGLSLLVSSGIFYALHRARWL